MSKGPAREHGPSEDTKAGVGARGGPGLSPDPDPEFEPEACTFDAGSVPTGVGNDSLATINALFASESLTRLASSTAATTPRMTWEAFSAGLRMLPVTTAKVPLPLLRSVVPLVESSVDWAVVQRASRSKG
jgi:hypothetical protein